jgi:hypothetical protein
VSDKDKRILDGIIAQFRFTPEMEGPDWSILRMGGIFDEEAGVVVYRGIVFVGDALVDPQEIE